MKSPRTSVGLFGRSYSSTTGVVAFANPSEWRSGGSGASSPGWAGGRTPSFRLLGLTFVLAALSLAAFLALTAPPAFAKEAYVFKNAFASEGSGNGQVRLQAPGENVPGSGLAIDTETGDVYVADTGNGRVEQFKADGTFVKAFGSFTEPAFVAIDDSPGGGGDLYVADLATNTVSKFKADGTPITAWGTSGELGEGGGHAYRHMRGIAVGPAGTLYVLIETPDETQRLLRFKPDGSFLDELILERSASPFGIAVDSSGDIFTVNSGSGSVQKFGPTGANLGTVTADSIALEERKTIDFKPYASGIAIDPKTGDLFVATAEAQRYEAAPGETYAHGTGRFPRPAIDRYDFNGAGEVIEGSGSCPIENQVGCRPTDTFGSEAPSGGSLEAPTGLAVDAAASVYLGDAGPQRIDLFPLVVLPDVTSEAATEVKAKSARLNGTVIAEGGDATCRFLWGTTEALTGSPIPCAAPIAAGATEQVHVTLNTEPNTTYYFRLDAENVNGVNEGSPFEIRKITTPGPAEIKAAFAKEVSADSAVLGARIDLHGVPTTYRFEYGPTSAYSNALPVPGGQLGSGTGPAEVSQVIGGLAPQTTYHYRIVTRAEVEPGVFEEEASPDHVLTTQGPATSDLIDDRQWQLVSPPQKYGGVIETADVAKTVQAAADGTAISYSSNAPTEAMSPSYSFPLPVLSTRDASAWSSKDIGNPHRRLTSAGSGEYVLFDEGLVSGLLQPFGLLEPSYSPEASEQSPFLRRFTGCASNCYRPLVSDANALPGFGEESRCEQTPGSIFYVYCGPQFLGATPDLHHVVLISPAPLSSGAGREQLYEWSSDGTLQQISILPENEAGEELPTPEGTVSLGTGYNPYHVKIRTSARRAISSDGARVFWEGEVGSIGTSVPALLMRDLVSHRTLQLDRAEPACESAGRCESGGGAFEIANVDGSSVLFTDTHRLTEESSKAQRDLYECKIVNDISGGPGCELTDLTSTGNNENAGVLSVLGASEDGHTAYFVATGVLTGAEENEYGTEAQPGEPNLYVRKDGSIHFVAALAPNGSGSGAGDSADWVETTSYQTVRVSPNGRWLAFMSERPITGYDNRDAANGQADAEVYLFDAESGKLDCVSCDPSGAQPHGSVSIKELDQGEGLTRTPWAGQTAATVPFSSANGPLGVYQTRALSDSGRVFFNSFDSLVPEDVNREWDVYESEPEGVGGCTSASPGYLLADRRCLGLVSSGSSGKQSAFLDASASGGDVFFLTSSRLVPQDVDSARDVYDFHECLGAGASSCFPAPPPSPPACAGDACQQPATPPNDPTPGSLTFKGAGNVTECPKGEKLKGGKCVKQKARKHKKRSNKKKGKKRPNSKHGGHK